jgi:hypothetical protein
MKKLSLFLSVAAFAVSAYSPGALALKIVDKKLIFEDLDDTKECIEKFHYNTGDCLKALDVWMKKNPNASYFQAAQMVQKGSNKYNAVPFYKAAFAKKQGDCSNTDVLDAVVAGFELPSDAPQVADGKELAFNTCWKEWKEDLAGQIDAKNSYYLKNTCGELAKKKALTPERQKICNS